MELGELTGRILRILDDEDETWRDIRAWHAPSECGVGIADKTDAKLAALIATAGYTPTTYLAVVRERTTGNDRWLFFHGLSRIFNLTLEEAA